MIQKIKRCNYHFFLFGGQTPDLDRIYDIAKKYGIILIEDCRSSLGATYNGKRVGNLRADMTIFSTNPSNSKYAISRSGIIIYE